MSVDTLTKPLVVKTDTGDHDRFTHIVQGDGKHSAEELLNRAKLYGIPVTALCGKTWVPDKDPANYPMCQMCIEEANHIPDSM